MLALVVAIIAAVVSALLVTDDSSSANQTVVATTSATSIPLATTGAPEPTATTATTTTASTLTAPGTPAKPPSSTGAAALAVWPAAKRGWTIVLDSVPSANGRAPAVVEARQALHVGMKQVGVLDSGQFSSLHPGYFVVFAGIYDTQAEAQSHVIDAHRHGYRGPYPRPISP